MKNILFICNESKTVINFRQELILFLQEKNYNVSVIVSDNDYVAQIKRLGVSCFVFKHKNHSKNIFAVLKLKRFYKKIIKNNHFDLVFTFQIKPNIFGSLAARKFKIPVVCMVEGLGNPFQPHSFKDNILELLVVKLYKKAFRKVKLVFFLNGSDLNDFLRKRIISKNRAFVIDGIGIDTKKFPFTDIPSANCTVIYLARLLKNKGIFEFCECAKKVRQVRPDISFKLYGSEAELNQNDIQKYIDFGAIDYYGYVENAKEVICSSNIMISTSYREGFPRIILEAMALGRPVIAFDSVGNKDIIRNSDIGILIENKSVSKMSEAIIELADNVALQKLLAKKARKYCEQFYDSSIINDIIERKIRSFL